MRKTALFVAEGGDSASAWYRSWTPAAWLHDHFGWDTLVTDMIVQDDDGRIRGFFHDGNDIRIVDPTDVVVCRRMNGLDGEKQDSTELIRLARARGQVVFVDIDDDLWHLPEHNPAFKDRKEGELAQWEAEMSEANGVIASTPQLADSVDNALPHVPVFVCRSGIDARNYDRNPSERDPIRLGWIGTTDFRGRDLAMIVPALRDVLKGKWDQTEFWHIGSDPRGENVRDILGSRFPVPIMEVPWVPISQLAQSLRHIDVAVIPFEASRFNDSRSCTLALPLMAMGIPFAASRQPEYDALFIKGAGLTVDNATGWESAIRILTEPEYVDARRSLRTGGEVLARARFNPLTTARQWHDVFVDALMRSNA